MFLIKKNFGFLVMIVVLVVCVFNFNDLLDFLEYEYVVIQQVGEGVINGDLYLISVLGVIQKGINIKVILEFVISYMKVYYVKFGNFDVVKCDFDV